MPLSNLIIELLCGNEKQAAIPFDRVLEVQSTGLQKREHVNFARRGSLLLLGSSLAAPRSTTLEETGRWNRSS